MLHEKILVMKAQEKKRLKISGSQIHRSDAGSLAGRTYWIDFSTHEKKTEGNPFRLSISKSTGTAPCAPSGLSFQITYLRQKELVNNRPMHGSNRHLLKKKKEAGYASTRAWPNQGSRIGMLAQMAKSAALNKRLTQAGKKVAIWENITSPDTGGEDGLQIFFTRARRKAA